MSLPSVTGAGSSLSLPKLADGQFESEGSINTDLLPEKNPTTPGSVLHPELEALRDFQEEFQLEDSELEKVVEAILSQENTLETFKMD